MQKSSEDGESRHDGLIASHFDEDNLGDHDDET